MMGKWGLHEILKKNFIELQLIIGLIGETLRVKSLVKKTLINRRLYIKVFHHQNLYKIPLLFSEL